MSAERIGPVAGIAIRTQKRGPMRELKQVDVTADGGLAGDVDATSVRAITFLSSGHWRQVIEDLGADLPWHTRRANVLIDCDGLGHLIGREVSVGDVRVRIHAETRPCDLMDELHPGLRAALEPDCRAGVYGSVVRDGQIAIGDMVTAFT